MVIFMDGGEYYWNSGNIAGFKFKGYWKNHKEWKGFYYNKLGRIHREVVNGVLKK